MHALAPVSLLTRCTLHAEHCTAKGGAHTSAAGPASENSSSESCARPGMVTIALWVVRRLPMANLPLASRKCGDSWKVVYTCLLATSLHVKFAYVSCLRVQFSTQCGEGCGQSQSDSRRLH